MQSSRFYNWTIQLSVFAFTIALAWFAFVYYPKMASDYKSGKVLNTKSVWQPVQARSENFPIETSAYRIVFEENADTYYAFIVGKQLDEYVFNRDNAKLALKSALSTDSLCGMNVIYISDSKLKVPEEFQNPDC